MLIPRRHPLRRYYGDGDLHFITSSCYRQRDGPVFPVLVSCIRLPCKGCPTLACCSRGWDSRMCATPLLTLSSSGNTRGQETQSSWAQNKRNSQTIQRREPKPVLINIHLIPPSRKSRESGAPESWWFHNETELKRLGHPSPTCYCLFQRCKLLFVMRGEERGDTRPGSKETASEAWGLPFILN